MIVIAVGLGMVLSLLFTETVGLAAGGVVVPGYIAMNMHDPFRVISTVLVGLATYGITKVLSRRILLYGRRLLIVSVLLGYLIGYATRLFPALPMGRSFIDLATIGYVIPGLIAYWLSRQGVVETLSAMIVVSVVVRLIIIVISGGAVSP